MEFVENRMIPDWCWEGTPAEIKEKMSGPGWRKIGTEIFVPEEDEFDYAIEHCTEAFVPELWLVAWRDDFKKMVVEWFYSDNWIKEE